jgi:hypothetical protein
MAWRSRWNWNRISNFPFLCVEITYSSQGKKLDQNLSKARKKNKQAKVTKPTRLILHFRFYTLHPASLFPFLAILCHSIIKLSKLNIIIPLPYIIILYYKLDVLSSTSRVVVASFRIPYLNSVAMNGNRICPTHAHTSRRIRTSCDNVLTCKKSWTPAVINVIVIVNSKLLWFQILWMWTVQLQVFSPHHKL